MLREEINVVDTIIRIVDEEQVVLVNFVVCVADNVEEIGLVKEITESSLQKPQISIKPQS